MTVVFFSFLSDTILLVYAQYRNLRLESEVCRSPFLVTEKLAGRGLRCFY